MKMLAKMLTVLFPLLALLITGCSQKETITEYNQPALHWYQKMIEQIRVNDLEKADDYFSSLQSEHINSPLLPEAMLILAQAHMDEEEYLLARFYVDEFIKRFGSKENIDFAKHLKIKAGYLSFKLTGRDQQLLLDTISEAESFIRQNPYSTYRPLVDTMLVKMHLANHFLNLRIAALYEKLEKPEAAEAYRNKAVYPWVNNLLATEPEEAWYRSIFNW